MKKERKVFRSRISILLIGLILVLFLPCFIPIFTHKIDQGMYIVGGSFAFILFVYSGIHYVISKDKLHLKIWFIPTYSLKINVITSMERSYCLFDIPTNTTASFRKLRIQFERKTKCSYINVSPVREQEFIEELKKVNPNISASFDDKNRIGSIWDWDI